MKKNAILDTNIFLHWDIQSVDWCKELGASSVELIVCLTVMQELDKKKEDHNRKLADRARKVLSLIESLEAEDKELREGVKVVVLDRSPRVNWDELGLDPLVEDDRIIASIIERNNKDDVLVTDDATPRTMARKKGIAVLKLTAPRLPEPKSDEEKELEKLRAELNEYKNRLPKLALTLESDEQHDEVPKFVVERPVTFSDTVIKEMVAETQRELEIKTEGVPRNLLFGTLVDIDMEGYRADVRNYLAEYEKYLNKKGKFDQEFAGLIRMNFVLSSDGKVPAEEVYCAIDFPEGYQLMEEDDLPEKPEEPGVPSPQPRFQRMMLNSMPKLSFDDMFPVSTIVPPKANGLRMRIDSGRVEAEVDKLQHNFEVRLRTVVVKLPSIGLPSNFEVKYAIHASNLPTPKIGSIPIIIELAGNSELRPPY